MKALAVPCLLAVTLFLSTRCLLAQDATEPDSRHNPEHDVQLANCRAGILDPEARPQDRHRWIDTLLAFDTPAAKDLVVELLKTNDHPAAQQSLCGVIAERGRRSPDRLDSNYLDPLIELLGASSDRLRSSAARALAGFPGSGVPARLGALAARDDAPMLKRLAAIDALAAKVDSRPVVDELMNLLDAGVPEITDRVTRALEPASRNTTGGDSSKWKAWWAEKSKLTVEEWLTDRLAMYRERYLEGTDAFDAFRRAATQRQNALAGRVADLQREVFRGLTREQREAKLVDWLGDSLAEVRRGALRIIRARIADEGKSPVGGALAALLHLLEDESPTMRSDVLLIVQNLNEPDVVDAVLARLDRERDSAVRQVIFKTIGKLDSPSAVPALIAEVASPDSSEDCVREAAQALGQVATEVADPLLAGEAVSALKRRYEQAAGRAPALRAALLSAMAGVAPASFGPQFREAIESSDPSILRPAIFGLMTIGESSKMPRLRALTADADPLVRQASVEAVARLGGEDADMESVLTRLNPAIESNELVRDSAWEAFQEIARKKPMSARIQMARRLRDTPDLELRYLLVLVGNLSATNGTADESEPVFDRLGTLLVEQGKHAEAVSYLRSLFEFRADRGAANAFEAGLRWLNAALQSHEQNDLAEIISRVAGSAEIEGSRTRIVEAVEEFFSVLGQQDDDGARILLAKLQSVRHDLLGESWTSLLDDLGARLTPHRRDAALPPPG